ncbi:MlaD family protein [Hymenobacter actinosclerus]|uniref:Phospholipid/cholesterol/gamma-HCH transport system substrate-binding protein n=1 Tax=Hymenobacter actinosclerus TaxID=82805 RepID=A0A1I0DXY9_9BACT|nr:MlaD family protein [Hymenobacter actinosclerus]SET37572.1 phospholipid/cholesterol/gamma-HCH transport system substrate-binding protein [Hymenobacter actinosclerus]
MPRNSTSNQVRLGLFVVVGVGCLLVVLYLLGSQQNLFQRSLPVQADFRNVSGLLKGNNVRLGGITVGTVKDITIINDTTVRVQLNLNQDVRAFVRRNAVASIGTDGLVGNTIINLTARPGAAPAVQAGDVLPTSEQASIDAMLATLDISNKNLVGITTGLRAVTDKLNDSKALWQLLSDEQLPADVRRSAQNAAAATAQLNAAATDVRQLTAGVRRGQGPLGYLLTDDTFADQIGHAARQLAGTSDTLAATLNGLQRQLERGGGPVQTLLTDTTAARQLRQTMRNTAQSTAKLNESMTALQSNFLLRGYFRRQARQQAHEAACAAARAKADSLKQVYPMR